MLSHLLNSHPDVTCERELLNPSNGYLREGIVLRALRVAPYPFLAFRSTRARTRAYGCKLMISHLRYPRLTVRVLHALGWKVLHVEREDIVEQVLSGVVARHTGRWRRLRGEQAASPRIRIEPEEFLESLRKGLHVRARELRALEGVPHHRVVYERDLADTASWPRTAAALCRALGLEEHELTARLAKVYEKPYALIVVNFGELLAAVSSSIPATSSWPESAGQRPRPSVAASPRRRPLP